MAAPNFDELALQLIQHIGSFFERINASSPRSITQFPDARQRNYLYVMYSASGMPLHAGYVEGDSALAARELKALTSSGAVASFRTVEVGNENLAAQLDRIIRDLFQSALPFAPAVGNGSTGVRRRGRPPGSGTGRKRGRPRKQDAGTASGNVRRGPGRPRKDAGEPVAVRRGPGRPRKNAEVAGGVKRGPGRPRKNPAAGAVAKRGPGRPRKDAAVDAVKRGPGRPRKNPETAAAAPKRRGRPRKSEAAAAPRRRGRPRKTEGGES